jgi:hypothetical protein
MQPSTTPLAVTYLRTTSLKPDTRNPRVHTDKQVRQIAQSIKSFGFNVPLLIDDQQLDGASDHGVSEALYLRDSDGNGVELYWDRTVDCRYSWAKNWISDFGNRVCVIIHARKIRRHSIL